MKRINIDRVELKGMSYFYDPESIIFKDVNFVFKPGEILYLQGSRGAGKNTLIKLLLGLLPPTEGEYLINNIRVNDFSHKEFDPFRLNIGYSFDVGGLLNNQTIYENFRTLIDYHNFLDQHERFDYITKMMERFELENIKHLRPAFISSSARKAASVLRAFTLKPGMMILNDPTQGLSAEHIPNLVELIRDHQRHHGLEHIIISSDDVGLINKLKGRIVKVTSSGLLDEDQIRSAG